MKTTTALANAAKITLIHGALLALSACGGGPTDVPTPPTPTPTPTYTVGGSVSGLSGTLVLQNSGSSDLTVSSSGAFVFTGAMASGSAYGVTVKTQPAAPAQTCVVANGVGSVSAGNVTNVAITCTTNTYTVGGTISGLTGTLVLQNNASNGLTLATNGSFTFTSPIASGNAYNVAVMTQPISPSQTCAVVSGTGTVSGGNVTNVAITCTTNTYTVGGTISGLSGTMILQNNASNNLTLTSNGSFTFTTPIASGNTYSIVVASQPSTTLTCTVANGGGVVSNANITAPVITCATQSAHYPRFAYVVNEAADTISAYTVNSLSGALTPMTGSPFAAGTHPAYISVDPAGKFAYVANFNSNNVSGYAINQNSGALTAIAGSPFTAGGAPAWVTTDPAGKFAYVTSSDNTPNNVWVYAINSTTGALTAVTGSPFAAGSYPRAVIIDPSGKFAYVTNQFSGNVSGYTVNPSTGALTAMAGSPFTAGTGPFGIAIDPSGKFAYVTNVFSHDVWAYTINSSTGALTVVTGSPFMVGTDPLSINIDPSGKFAYVANEFSDNVSAHTIDPTTGALTALTGSPFATGSRPNAVSVDPSGKFAYVANSHVDTVSAYAINPTTGDLTTLASSPTVTGSSPFSIAITGTSVPPCVAPTGAGTTHGSINAAETWTAAGSPHIVPFDISLYAAVTIEACAVVRIAANATVTITATGNMTAAGASGRPVTIEALTVGTAWSSIRNLGGTLSLTHAVITGGGAPLNTTPAYAGVLHMQSPNTVGTFHVDDVEILGSQSQGVYINDSVGFDATSQDLRIHGSVGFPVHVYARVIGSIPTGDYTGNGRDEIGIAGAGGPVLDNQTMHNRGVPYHVGSGQDGGRMDINSQVSGAVAVLTIEPGVTIRFPSGGLFNVDPANGSGPALGALIAIGDPTPAGKIVFTSDQGVASHAGDWLGIRFGNVSDPRSTMQNVVVEFAGGASTTGSNSCPYPNSNGINDAAIRIFGPPLTQFITNTEIVSSARFGIDRGWRSDLQPDFLATNTFTSVGSCKETTPRTAAGACPTNPACP